MLVQAMEVHQIAGSFTIDVSQFTSTNEAHIRTLSSIYFGPMVGASGAIFGLLIAFGVLYPDVELLILFIPIPIKAKYIIPAYVVLELVLGIAQFSGDSIAHFAHLGGALFGFILIKVWQLRRIRNF